MSKFYADPKLGIKNDIDEETPTNNAGVVQLPCRLMQSRRKRKILMMVGQKRRAFYKRMRERMQTRIKTEKKVQESTLERASILAEDNVDVLKKIVKDKQNTNIRFKDGSMKVDLFTASAITQVYDAVNSSNKKKMEKLINGKKADFMKIADFALSKVK